MHMLGANALIRKPSTLAAVTERLLKEVNSTRFTGLWCPQSLRHWRLRMVRDIYRAQVSLLIRILPYVAKESIFALKGGTAINLFYRDLPRLSVDIDLTYLPVKDRMESLAEINEAMDRIAAAVEKGIPRARTSRIAGGGGGATRLLARLDKAEIKVETSPVTRGVVHDPELKEVRNVVADDFGYAEIQVVAFGDLFGGKIHAALDRQHPRDLYDIKLLYENEGMTDELFRTFLVYLSRSSRPAHELLKPNCIDLTQAYEREFLGMTDTSVSLDTLTNTRDQLIADIQSRLDNKAQGFLRSLHEGTPDFTLIDLPNAGELPAVRWKVLNLQKLIKENPKKHDQQRKELENLFT